MPDQINNLQYNFKPEENRFRPNLSWHLFVVIIFWSKKSNIYIHLYILQRNLAAINYNHKYDSIVFSLDTLEVSIAAMKSTWVHFSITIRKILPKLEIDFSPSCCVFYSNCSFKMLFEMNNTLIVYLTCDFVCNEVFGQWFAVVWLLFVILSKSGRKPLNSDPNAQREFEDLLFWDVFASNVFERGPIQNLSIEIFTDSQTFLWSSLNRLHTLQVEKTFTNFKILLATVQNCSKPR